MSEQGSFDDDRPTTLGRGRGRGSRMDPELPESVTSTSTKRSTEAGNGNGNGHGNGNGQKRGNMRDQKPLGIYNTRPDSVKNSKKGTSGRTVQLTANYFKLLRKPNFEFTLYRVDFEPEIELANLRKFFVGQQREMLGGYLFDGVNMIYLTHKLAQDRMEIDCQAPREGINYKMKIKNTFTTIQPTDSTAMQILNVLLRRTMDGLKLQMVGRNLYDPTNRVRLPQFRVELWPGYITSIRQHEEDILVCTEVSHKVMRQETIYEILRDVKNSGARDWQDAFKKEIVGTTVLTDYNNHTYRIDDVDFKASPSSTFKKKDQDVSYKSYYENRYNLVIRDDKQPMLVSNPKPRDIRDGRTQLIYLVPELCKATGITDKMRANFAMMRGMAEHTQMDPVKRTNRLLDYARRLHNTPESSMQMAAFNTNLDSKLIAFEGRALNQETMLYGNNKTSLNDDNVDWTNAMKQYQMFHCVPLTRWAFIYPQRSAHESDTFLNLMREVSNGMKYHMTEPKKFMLTDDRTHSYVAKIEEVMLKDPLMIVIIAPNTAADRYSAIKRITCVNRAVPTQVIASKTITPKQGKSGGGVMTIATKVMIQINAKLGGAPWMIKFPLNGTMTIGFDVTRDTREKRNAFGAFVASMDLKKAVRYYSAVSSHKDGTEVSTNIENHMVQALKAFNRLHDTLPERIFFYRDGVGDGEIEYIHKQEVVRLNAKLKDIYFKAGKGKPVQFSFILVNKRLNTRIFRNIGPRPENPKSGTVVDSTITLPERYDFFLVSQSVRQGTVAPTSYNIICDSNGLKPDQMQVLTYKQCHLYYNWSGTVRVPAVVQYAHKLAFLVGNFLHQPPSMDFDNQLYFL